METSTKVIHQRSLAHLFPPGKARTKRTNRPIIQKTHKFVQIKDRIPFWNIVPQDTVKLIKGDKSLKGRIGSVVSVDMARNRVWLDTEVFGLKKPFKYPVENGQGKTVKRAFHVHNLRLVVDHEGTQYAVTRMKRSAPRWDPFGRCFRWRRYGYVPELVSESHSGWVEVPFPKEEKPEPAPAGPLEADEALALENTWKPSFESLLTKPDERQIHDSEFGNAYHSRANKTKRFTARVNARNEAKKLAASPPARRHPQKSDWKGLLKKFYAPGAADTPLEKLVESAKKLKI